MNCIQIIIMLLILKVATRVLQLLLCLPQLIHRLIVICAQIIEQFLKLDAFLLKLIHYLIDCLFCLRIYRSFLFEQIRNYLNIIYLRINCFWIIFLERGSIVKCIVDVGCLLALKGFSSMLWVHILGRTGSWYDFVGRIIWKVT